MSNPKVSVIIPTYNRAHLISQALESVFAQTFRDYEVIVVDDGSTDDTHGVLEPYRHRIHYVWQENYGISAARNKGILLSRGDYVAFLDSDDTWYPDKLKQQVAYLERHPHVSVVYGQILADLGEGSNGKKVLPRKVVRTFQDLVRESNTIPTSVTMVRRKCFETVGLFNPSFPVAEDFELWLRIARHFRIEYLEGIVGEYKVHASNTTHNVEKVYRGYLKVFEKILSAYGKELEDPELVKLIKNRVSMFRYLLGTQLLKAHRSHEATGLIAGALWRNWRLGMLFAKGNESLRRKLFLSVKPYGAFFVSLFLGIFPSRQLFAK